MRRWPVATAEETDVCSQCRKSGGKDFLGVVGEEEEEEEKAAQRLTQLPLGANAATKGTAAFDSERHRLKLLGRNPTMTSRWHCTAAATSSLSVQVHRAAKQSISWGGMTVAAVRSSTQASTPTIWKNSSSIYL